MSEFPHLGLPNRLTGVHKPSSGGRDREKSENTLENIANREEYGGVLSEKINNLSRFWKTNKHERRIKNLPDLPDPAVVPVYLQIDAEFMDAESLSGFGIEIISEEGDGFIIGASGENFAGLKKKIEHFVQEKGRDKDQAAKLWKIDSGLQWRVDQILVGSLKDRWDKISDEEELSVDVGIACNLKISAEPTIRGEDVGKKEKEEAFAARKARWKKKKNQAMEKRDEIALERQTEFEKFVKKHGGTIDGSFVDYEDSFCCRITVTGKALKDIVLNYQYLFEVEDIGFLDLPAEVVGLGEIDYSLEVKVPSPDSPGICIIDSGIQEGHRLLADGIESGSSYCFVNNTSVADDVLASGGGHGTRVAGAVLFPHNIPADGEYELPFFIQNARILERDGNRAMLPKKLFPPKLMEDIVQRFGETKIFNMSVNYSTPCRVIHMSQWASVLDKLMHENDILFVLSAGNIAMSGGNHNNPSVKRHLDEGRNYPDFLLEASGRISNPAQSAFALTVGSVCVSFFEDRDKKSFGEEGMPSAFSRTGPGLWGMIKPDVVEYAGDYVCEKNNDPNISVESDTSPVLVRATQSGVSGVGSDDVGTSYAAPRVARIAGMLQKIYPNMSSNLFRVLIAQSARWPQYAFDAPKVDYLRHFGYGIPDIQRATENSERRVTLITSDSVSAKNANVYSIKVPEEIRAPGRDYDILIEVTLAFTSKVRRTRRRTNSYLSTWLDWHSSKLGESLEDFKGRVLKGVSLPEGGVDEGNTIKWVIRENKAWSKLSDVRRQDSSLQKSWCVMKSYKLPEEISFSVAGHAGWNPDNDEEIEYSFAVSFESMDEGVNVYQLVKIENEIEVPLRTID